MGHTRIGRLRRSLKWKEVVLSFCAGANFDKLAGDILQAAKDNLNEQSLTQDASYQKAVYLLVQMGIGAQSKDFIGHMHAIGIDLTPNPSVQELIGKVSEAVDDAAWQQPGTKCDLGEFAKLGLVNAITHVAHLEKDVNPQLPGMPPLPGLAIFNTFGKRHNLAELNRIFISRTMAHALNYYMAKFIPNLTGHTDRILSIQELNASYEALQNHCYETTLVHKEYVTEWLAKHQYKMKDMNEHSIVRHANYMVKKMLTALIEGVD